MYAEYLTIFYSLLIYKYAIFYIQRLADIAHSLLKVSPYDPESMACRGLQLYVNSILPRADWLDDAMKPALTTILRRLDKVFLKISKKPSIRVKMFCVLYINYDNLPKFYYSA